MVNFIILILLKLKQKRDLDAVLRDASTLNLDKDLLTRIYNDATREPMSFLKIDLSTADENKTFSKGFTQFYAISDA